MTAHPLLSTCSPTPAMRMPANAGARRAQGERRGDDIHECIAVAVLEHRLHPGAKLGEAWLAESFGVSRARIRDVLARLARDQIVDLHPHRGAFVAKPSIEQAREVFEARRLIEPAVLRRLIATLTPQRIKCLQRHLQLESDAGRRKDRHAMIRLSGEFHTLAAELAGNAALARAMRQLCMLTCLTIFLHDAPTATCCRSEEHRLIVDAIARRDRPRAQRLMLAHLAQIERHLEAGALAPIQRRGTRPATPPPTA